MSDGNDTVDFDFYSGENFSMPVSLRFWLYLIPNVLSISCSIFALYHLLLNRSLRRALNNHVIIVLLVIGQLFELLDVPFSLYYYRFGSTWHLSDSFSLFWTYIDFASYTSQIVIFAWATIERHILIFHYNWISTRRKRLFVHYLPVIILFVYVFVYSFYIVYLPPCVNLYDFSYINGVPLPCAIDNVIIAKYDLICHEILPTFTTVIFSIALLIRILCRKRRFTRSLRWRGQRKVAIQLLSISSLYLIFNFPWSLIDLFFEIGLPVEKAAGFRSYAYYFSCYIIFLFPFVCCGSLPELRKKVKQFICCRRHQRVAALEVFHLRPIVKT